MDNQPYMDIRISMLPMLIECVCRFMCMCIWCVYSVCTYANTSAIKQTKRTKMKWEERVHTSRTTDDNNNTKWTTKVYVERFSNKRINKHLPNAYNAHRPCQKWFYTLLNGGVFWPEFSIEHSKIEYSVLMFDGGAFFFSFIASVFHVYFIHLFLFIFVCP